MSSSRPTLAPASPALASPPRSARHTRFARVSDPDVWLEAPHSGFVGAIISSMEDGHDRVVLAWPSRPDNGFVASAIALREVRTSYWLTGTLALWPWRSAAMHAARSILVHPNDICLAAREAYCKLGDQEQRKHPKLAHDSLCIVELRLNDLLPSRADNSKPQAELFPIYKPTLPETTAAFAPSGVQPDSVYVADPDQVLRRVRRHTTLRTSAEHVANVGNPLLTPFALMGLNPADRDILARCLNYRRFIDHGLDAVVIDLTRNTRCVLAPDWQRQLLELLTILDTGKFPRRPPIVVLCEDVFTMRRAELAIQGHAQKAQRRRPLKLGALLLRAGILEVPGTYTVQTLPPVTFSADIKDASLAPLRDRLISLSRDMREAGQANSAAIVGKAIHTLSTFASLPFGISEARQAASILFDGDGRNEVEARTSFFPTSALQQMAEIEAAVPAFAVDIRRLLNEIRAHVNEWEQATPVSLKLAQLLGYPEWNAPDVLLVLPDPRTVDMFLVSDCGVNCTCTVIDVSQLAEQANTTEWRRIVKS